MRIQLAAILTVVVLALAGSAFAQAPGTPLAPPCFTTFNIAEGPTEVFADEHQGPLPLPCPVTSGYVVLVESSDPVLQHDPHNWSDIVAFSTGGPVQPGALTDHFIYISDSVDPTTNTENGLTVQDLAFAGLTAADVIANPTTVYLQEGLGASAPEINVYTVTVGTQLVQYLIRSDKPEGPTPTAPRTWGRIKTLYR